MKITGYYNIIIKYKKKLLLNSLYSFVSFVTGGKLEDVVYFVILYYVMKLFYLYYMLILLEKQSLESQTVKKWSTKITI